MGVDGSHLRLEKVKSWPAGLGRDKLTRYKAWDGGVLVGHVESYYPDITIHRGGLQPNMPGRVKSWWYHLEGDSQDDGGETWSRREAVRQLWELHLARAAERTAQTEGRRWTVGDFPGVDTYCQQVWSGPFCVYVPGTGHVPPSALCGDTADYVHPSLFVDKGKPVCEQCARLFRQYGDPAPERPQGKA